MITEQFIRDKFISETLRSSINKIYATQQQVVRDNYQVRSGRLFTSLSAHNFSSASQGCSHTFFVRILPYLRFLDMAYRHRNDRLAKARRHNLALYNRVVWGVLYHETFPEFAYGFTDEVRKQFGAQLKEIFNTDCKTYFKQ
ncbi:MAG: hypothetical protein ACTTJL_06750 [Hoylesella enoeca]|uniref:hypothetical protein n=1 Tax=Hoylesella enoeca TaxID=76123 RepID=UPI003FA0386A